MNVTIKRINNRDIYVVDGRLYILLGGGGGAMSVSIEEANADELKFAVGPDRRVECDLVAAFKEAVKTTETTAETTETETTAETTETDDKYVVDNTAFDTAVNELAELPAGEFMELVDYAKRHGNKFPEYSKFDKVVNADDAYCSALIKLTRSWSKEVENKAFEVFGACSREKVVKMIIVLQAAYNAGCDSGGDVGTYYCIKEVVDAYMSTL